MEFDLRSFRALMFKFYQLSRGRNVFKHLHDFERTQWLSEVELNQMQWQKLKELLDYVYSNVPYYKKIFKESKLTPRNIKIPENFRKIPILTKNDIEKNISTIVSSKYRKRDLIENSTGGSTGRNLRFFNDLKRVDIKAAINMRGDSWAGLEIGTKHAYLWGSPFDASLQDGLKNKIYNKLVGCDLFLSSYDLSKETMYLYAKKLQDYNPKVIIGYPSALYPFAKFLEENEIKNINPKAIISSAEVLYDYQRELIESVFRCEVFNRYGCREFGAIAQECLEHSGLHLNTEHIYLEFLDENGEPARNGEMGELIITDLDNFGMPFVRYKIEDVGKLLGKKCKCGRGLPLIEVEGRTFDVIVGTNGRYLGGTFWTLLFRSVDGIKQFQVVQESEDEINVKLVVEKYFKPDEIDKLSKKIKEYCGDNMKVTFEITDKINLTDSGKHRFIISRIRKKF